MSLQLKNINDNSEKFLPAFTRLRAPNSGHPVAYEPLKISFDNRHPMPLPGERPVTEWAAVASCLFTVTEDGLPLPPDGGTGALVKLFEGSTSFVVTEQRLLLLVFDGETVLGEVGEKADAVLIASLPLEEIGSVRVKSKKRLLGGVKEDHVNITCLKSSVAALQIENAVVAPDGTGGYQSYNGTLRDILESFVGPVVSARMPTATADQRVYLTDVQNGKREETSDEFMVDFGL